MAEGVALASMGSERDAALNAIRAGRPDLARRVVLGKHAMRVRAMEMLGIPVTFRRYTRHWMLGELLNRCRLRQRLERPGLSKFIHNLVAAATFNVYLRHRHCAPPLVSAIPLLGLLRGTHAPILDAPCGMGHLSYLLSKIVPQDRLICMDLAPYFVYAARRFFVPEAKLAVAYDMSQPLPLADNSVGAIFCLDAFQYIPNKQQLAREMMRILRDDDTSFVAILHAYNRFHYSRYSGEALSPREYAQLFDGYHVRLYPESYMLDAFARDVPLDLSREFSLDELNRCEAVHLIAAKSPDVFRVVQPVANQVIDRPRRAPRLNPLYDMYREGEKYVFVRRLPEVLRAEFAKVKRILPRRVTVPASEVHHGGGGQLRFRNPAKLLRMHVLVDLPEGY